MAKILIFPPPVERRPQAELRTLFSVQTCTLTAMHEAQALLLCAAQAIATLQLNYVEQMGAKATARLAMDTFPKTDTLLADLRRAVVVAEEVIDIAIAAQAGAWKLLCRHE